MLYSESNSDDIRPGDIVAVNHGSSDRKEGLVIDAHWDYAGRRIVVVQLSPADIYHAWWPTVTRVRRTVSISGHKPRTIERRIYF